MVGLAISNHAGIGENFVEARLSIHSRRGIAAPSFIQESSHEPERSRAIVRPKRSRRSKRLRRR